MTDTTFRAWLFGTFLAIFFTGVAAIFYFDLNQHPIVGWGMLLICATVVPLSVVFMIKRRNAEIERREKEEREREKSRDFEQMHLSEDDVLAIFSNRILEVHNARMSIEDLTNPKP